MYFGHRALRSVATLMEFAEMLTPIEANKKAKAQKKAATRPPWNLSVEKRCSEVRERITFDVHMSTIRRGSQRSSPYKILLPFAPIIPKSIMTMNTTGITNS